MSTPSPLVPQGSIQDAPKGRRNLPVLVFSVIGFHVVALGVGLMIGCKPETSRPTNPLADLSTSNAVAPLVTDTVASTSNAAPAMNPYQLPSGPMPAPGASAGTAPAPLGGPSAPVTGSSPGAGAAPVPATGGFGAPGSVAEPVVPAVEPATAAMTEHKVKNGDSFSKMAKEYGVSVGAIIAANPTLDPRRLKVGQTVTIPAAAHASAAPAASGRSPGATTTGTYVVKPGDSLTRIAKSHGTTVKALKSLNRLKTDHINAGKKLKVPVKAEPTVEPAAEAVPAPAPGDRGPASPAFGTVPPAGAAGPAPAPRNL